MKKTGIGVIIFGIICLPMNPIVGIPLIFLGVFLYRKKKKQDPPVPISTSAPAKKKDAETPEGIPSAKPRKQFSCKVAGVSFKCAMDEEMTRQEVLEGVHNGQIVSIVPYKYKGEPAYYVVDPDVDLDFGNLPADISEEVSEFENPTFEAYVKEVDYFYPDDKDEPIYYCVIQGFVL